MQLPITACCALRDTLPFVCWAATGLPQLNLKAMEQHQRVSGEYCMGFSVQTGSPFPPTRLTMLRISPEDGWCDAPGNSNYNRPVKLPYPHSHEELFRNDRLYDFCLVVDYNISSRIQHRGKCCFFSPNQHRSKAYSRMCGD